MSQIQGKKELFNKFDSMDKGLVECIYSQMKKETEQVRSRASLLCPVNHGELKQNIFGMTLKKEDSVQGIVYTNKEYAAYVEFGTGPKGQANHEGISPNVNVTYSQKGWAFPAEGILASDAQKYGWPKRIYGGKEYFVTSGQAAQPFMYPALKDYEETAKKNIANAINKYLRGLGK